MYTNISVYILAKNFIFISNTAIIVTVRKGQETHVARKQERTLSTDQKLKNSDEIKKLMSLGLEKQFNCKVFAIQT